MQQFSKYERKAIASLSIQANDLFNVLENAEIGQLIGTANLCSCLENNPEFISFSCLSGNQEKQELGENLGALFIESKIRILQNITQRLGARFTIFIDDTEPIRIWQWPTPQSEISEWCQLVIESTEIPKNWSVQLWSHVETGSGPEYQQILEEVSKPKHAMLVHRRLAHMKEFPNKKIKDLKGRDLEHAATRRVAQYALQGLILEKKMPSAILLQSETPWGVKDPLYQALRKNLLPIVHPFKERR